MNDAIHIACPHDGAVNRVPAGRLAESPRCGKCHQSLFEGRPLELTTANFDVHLAKSNLPLLVDFWAPWCGPCRMMAPAFEKAAGLLEPRMRLAKLNTEDETAIAGCHDIRSIPTLILFSGGQEVARQTGALGSAELIARWATSHLPR